jgi:4-hydroxy-tetrahydrodipicolinate synthase
MILYNNPHSTGTDAAPELVVKLGQLANITHVKESSGDVTRVARILELGGGQPRVLCGSDNEALESLCAGAVGWIAACANVLPGDCVRLFEWVRKGQLAEAQALYRRIYPLFDLAESTGKFAQVAKEGVTILGGRAGGPRRPLAPLDRDLAERLAGILQRIGSA